LNGARSSRLILLGAAILTLMTMKVSPVDDLVVIAGQKQILSKNGELLGNLTLLATGVKVVVVEGPADFCNSHNISDNPGCLAVCKEY
jgi:hypothetical protein